jgi:ribosome-binding protein aMBF1 (putative translation factor)
MSGHQRFAEIRDNSPAFRAEVDAEMAAVRVASKLVRLREDMGLDQQQVAERMVVSREMVNEIESARDVRLSSIVGYVAALGGAVRLTVHVPDRETVELDLPAAS